MRITGGTLRSRPLRAPRGDTTRPTSDRVREALFSILRSAGVELEGANVLDVYAGSGALAFEALSRGAACATVVEKGREALQAIRANAEALGVGDRVRVVGSAALKAAGELAGAGFDVVFADPPYADVPSGAATRVLEALVASRAVAEGATLVLEHASADEPPAPAGLSLESTRRYGDTALSFYRADPA